MAGFGVSPAAHGAMVTGTAILWRFMELRNCLMVVFSGQYLSQQHPVVDDCAILRNEDADSSCDAVESCLVGCVVKGQSHV